MGYALGRKANPFESHLILYVIDASDDVFILRVRHGREDWQHDE